MLAFLFRADARAVDVEGPNVYNGRPVFGSTKATVFKRESLLNGGGGSMSIGVGPGPAIIRQR